MSTGNTYPIDGKPETPEPHESARAYAAFCMYRDLGPGRSVAAAWNAHQATRGAKGMIGVVQQRSRPSGRWNLWSSKYHWIDRAAAHDRKIDEAKCAAILERAIQYKKVQDAFKMENQQEKIRTVREMNEIQHKLAVGPFTDITQCKEETVGGKTTRTTTNVKGYKVRDYTGLVKQNDATSQLILEGGTSEAPGDKVTEICWDGEDAA
jgi:hypothetical protein